MNDHDKTLLDAYREYHSQFREPMFYRYPLTGCAGWKSYVETIPQEKSMSTFKLITPPYPMVVIMNDNTLKVFRCTEDLVIGEKFTVIAVNSTTEDIDLINRVYSACRKKGFDVGRTWGRGTSSVMPSGPTCDGGREL